MSSYNDIPMDFGDDDDADEFLTGKLAALGIDEDLVLSEDEEESQDDAAASATPSALPERQSAAAVPALLPAPLSPRSASTPPPVAAAGAAGAGTEDWGKAQGDEEESEDNAAAAPTPVALPKRQSNPDVSALLPASSSPPCSTPPPVAAAAAAVTAARGDLGVGLLPVSEVSSSDKWRDSAKKEYEQHPPAAAERRGGVEQMEDGEVVELLKKPLQAPRHRGGGSGGGRRSGGRGSGKGEGGRPNNNGRDRGRNMTIKECAKWMCENLGEPKYYLMCRVVSTIGYNKTRRLLDRVREVQDNGGMPTADGSRNRTAGGVFFTLLKEHMDPAKLKELYADEVKVKKEKERARRAAIKRKAMAALAGEDVMTPRDRPRSRGQGSGRGGSSSDAKTSQKLRTVEKWVGPSGGGVGDDAAFVVAAKRARANMAFSGDEEGEVATRTPCHDTNGASQSILGPDCMKPPSSPQMRRVRPRISCRPHRFEDCLGKSYRLAEPRETCVFESSRDETQILEEVLKTS